LTADNSVFQYSNANDMHVDTRFELFRGDYRSCAMFS
jgi:hypothetical protein